MTEQFKLVKNAQESKISKSNATGIKIKCSNNFPRQYCVNYLHKLGIKRKFHSTSNLQIALQMTHSDWSNLVTHAACYRPKRGENREALRTRGSFGKAGENGGKFHTFCEEEIGGRLPKNIARISKIPLSE